MHLTHFFNVIKVYFGLLDVFKVVDESFLVKLPSLNANKVSKGLEVSLHGEELLHFIDLLVNAKCLLNLPGEVEEN